MARIVVTEQTAESTPTPASGKSTIIIDDKQLKTKHSDGTVKTYSTGVTAEDVQDIVGGMLLDTSTIDLNYDDPNAQISATVKDSSITNTKIAAGVDATKISSGIVSNTEFNYLDGLTSNIQSQINTVTTSVSGKAIFAGCIEAPTYTDNGGGSITVNSVQIRLFPNSTFDGEASVYTLSPITVTLNDNDTNYIVGSYNSGTPILLNTSNVELITESDVCPVLTIYRSGSYLHILHWDEMGNGLANKLHQSIVKTDRYRRESGLLLSETGTRNVLLTSGNVWIGAHRVSIGAFNSSTDLLFYMNRTGANAWTTSVVTQYNNNDYFNGTSTVALSSGSYAVCWMYRGCEVQNHMYFVLGEGNYNFAQAQASQPPSNLPEMILSHAILVGRIIVKKGDSTASQIDSAFAVTFTASRSVYHNETLGIQGGVTGEYYHLTSALAGYLSNVTSDIQTQFNNLSTGKENTVSSGTTSQFYRGDKTWQTPPNATTSTSGYLSAADKTKLDSVPSFKVVKSTATTSTTSNTVLSNITGLAVTCTAGKVYELKFRIPYTVAATTTGIIFALTKDGTLAGTLVGRAQTFTSSTAQTTYQITGFNLNLTFTASPFTNVLEVIIMFNCTTGGVMTPQFASEVSGSQVALQGFSLVEIIEA